MLSLYWNSTTCGQHDTKQKYVQIAHTTLSENPLSILTIYQRFEMNDFYDASDFL